jgi:hypothetical protein
VARSTRAKGHARRLPAQQTDLVAALSRVSLETRALLVILLGALILRILPLGAFSTEYDEGVYWLSLRAMAQGHALYSSIAYAQPPAFLLSVYPGFLLLGQTLLGARFVVTLFSLVGIAALYSIGKGLGGRYVGLAAAAVLAVDPLYVALSRTLEAEVPALAFMLVGVALALEAARQEEPADRRRRVLVLASGALLGLAVMTKLLAIVGIVPAVVLLAWPELLPRRGAKQAHAGRAGRARSARDGRPIWDLRAAAPDLGLLVAGLIGACLLILLLFLGNANALYQQVIGLHLAAAHALGAGPANNLRVIGAISGGYWLFGAALAAIALAIWRRSLLVVPGAAWALASLLMLVTQQPLWPRHVVLLAPPLALLAALLLRLAPPLRAAGGWRFAPSTRRLRQALKQTTLITYGALILLGAVFVVGLITTLGDDERAIEYPAADSVLISDTLGRLTPPGDIVVTDDPYLVGLAGRDVPPELIDTSFVRIATGDLTAKQLEEVIARDKVSTILFASGRFARVPGFRDWVKQNFQVRQDFGGGRVLYVRQPQGPVNA